MNAAITCPKCGTSHPTGTAACGCGHTFPVTAASTPEQAIPIERPFDIGKPLGTAYPVSAVCPQCGSKEYRTVQPTTMVAFTWDRVCQGCATRYTPPTPVWARVVFGVIRLAAVAVGAVIGYGMLVPGGRQPTFGLLTPAVAVVVGFACLYKAVTR